MKKRIFSIERPDLLKVERYIRQAGVDIKGITACLDDIHDPLFSTGTVLSLVTS